MVFSIIDVVAVLVEAQDYDAARNYWKVTKHRMIKEGNEPVTNCNQLKLKAADGKRRLADVATTEELLRIIQSIPSKKAEPIKLWLAEVGCERIDETLDPEPIAERLIATYERPGYFIEWINQCSHSRGKERGIVMERDEKREYLISLRESTGMTRKDFANEYEIPYPTITDWELGHRRVPEYFLRLLAYQVGLRNNDCCFVSGKNWFRYRTGAIIIEDNKVLFATDDTIDYYYTVGGGVHLGESSEDCIKREVFEETGVDYEVDHLAAIVENFFDGHGGKIEGMDCHCLEFYFLMKSRGSTKIDSHSTNAVGAIEHMKWIPLVDIDRYNIKPSFLKERLKEIINSDKVLHIVSEADRAYKYTLSKNELNFPTVIYDYLKGSGYNINDVGMSDSQVYIFDKYVLKVQPVTAETDNEYAVLKWLSGKCPTPMILEYVKEKNKAYTLMTKAVGKMLCDDEYMRKPQNLVTLVAKGLKLLWDVDISDCPCNYSRLSERLKQARINVMNGNVDLDNVEPETFGLNEFKNPLELIEWLENNQPEEDLVLSHGDFCLPNIFTDGENITAFIDNGKMGPADRWQDIAIVLRSLKSNFSGKYTGGVAYEGYEEDMLLKEIGISMDEKKYRYYLLLDELF